MEIEFDRYDYGGGQNGLIFSPPRVEAFATAGLSGSGHDWERLLRVALPRIAPGVLAEIKFDCESDLFVAISANPQSLAELEAVIAELLRDEAALKVFAREAAREA